MNILSHMKYGIIFRLTDSYSEKVFVLKKKSDMSDILD